MSTDTVIRPLEFTAVSDPDQERTQEKARLRGHAAGFAAGAAEGTRALAADRALAAQQSAADARAAAARTEYVLSVLQSAAEAMFSRAAPVSESMEDALAEAALQLAEAILGHELADGTASARAALARATGTATPSPVHTVRMHPDDLGVLDGPTRAAAGVAFVADASLRRGDAVADYADGFLDARLSASLDRMRSALTGAAQ
ncbi:MAG TPA: FliH/SctL family protein [Arthrobacter sp.]